MTDTSRPPDCQTCQDRASAIREQRDPYTFCDLFADTATLAHAERAAALVAATARGLGER